MSDILDNRSIAVPEARLVPDGCGLDGLKLFGAIVAQNGNDRLQLVDLYRQPRRLEGGTLLWRTGDDQHRQFGGAYRGKFQSGFGISEAQTDVAGQKCGVEIDRSVERIRIDENARIGLKDHRVVSGRGDSILGRLRSYSFATVASTALIFAGAVSLVVPHPAYAITVFDPANYAQNVLQAARSLQQITNQITSLQNQAQMLVNQARNLASLPISSLEQIEQSVRRTQQLLSQAQNIAYDVQQIDRVFQQKYANVSMSASDRQLVSDARSRWQNTVGGLQDAMKVQATVVGNIDTNRAEMTKLVTASQGATGALQATQAGNQLLALQAQQLADLTAVVAANGRAQALSDAERAAAAEQGREQRRRFLTPGAGYQPGNARMFPGSGN